MGIYTPWPQLLNYQMQAMPLKLIGVSLLRQKKMVLLVVLCTCWSSSLLCCQNMSFSHISYQNNYLSGYVSSARVSLAEPDCARVNMDVTPTGAFLVGEKKASSIFGPLDGCIFMCLKPAWCFLTWLSLSEERSAPQRVGRRCFSLVNALAARPLLLACVLYPCTSVYIF